MSADSQLDDLTLNAYVDGQLDPEMESVVLTAIQGDPDIRERVCRLRRAKDWVKNSFEEVHPETRPLPRRGQRFGRFGTGIAASLLAIAMGAGGAILGYNCAERDTVVTVGKQDPMRVVLHLDDAGQEHFQAVLDYAEHFLESNRDRGAQVEVVANAGGVDLMRSGGSIFEARVRQLKEQYANLHFVACVKSLRNLQQDGVEPAMIDDVDSGTTAVDRIVMRIRDGWTYRKANNLEDI